MTLIECRYCRPYNDASDGTAVQLRHGM